MLKDLHSSSLKESRKAPLPPPTEQAKKSTTDMTDGQATTHAKKELMWYNLGEWIFYVCFFRVGGVTILY